MTGTAVLYKENQQIVILRNIEKDVVEQIKTQCGSEHSYCQVEEKKVDYGRVSHVIWMEQRADIGD